MSVTTLERTELESVEADMDRRADCCHIPTVVIVQTETLGRFRFCRKHYLENEAVLAGYGATLVLDRRPEREQRPGASA